MIRRFRSRHPCSELSVQPIIGLMPCVDPDGRLQRCGREPTAAARQAASPANATTATKTDAVTVTVAAEPVFDPSRGGPSHSRRGCDARRTTAGTRRPGRPSSAVAAGIDALAADRSQAVLDLVVVRRQEPRADERIVVTPMSPVRFFEVCSHTPCTDLPPSAVGVAVRVIKLPAAIASLATTVRVTVPAVDQS